MVADGFEPRKNWGITGESFAVIFAIDMVSPGRHTTSGRADISRKESKDYQISLEDLIISNTRR